MNSEKNENVTVDYDKLHIGWNRAHIAGSPVKYVRDGLIFLCLSKLPNGRTLEAGCGFGAYSQFLVQRKHSVDAFDPSILAVENLKKICKEFSINVFQSDCENFSTDKVYDNLICAEVLEHVANDLLALSRLVSCVKEGGNILLSVPASPLLYSEVDKAAGHYRRYTRASFKQLLLSSGIKEIKIHSYGFPVLFAYSLLRKLNFVQDFVKKYIEGQNDSGIRKNDGRTKMFYHMIFAIDRLNIPFGSVGYVAICRK
ncbi:MAG: class I SAM-dependent methyltransferase [Bacteroidetes bacterium]|nr:class I SAM-dependent methyltransferase [Bacteroidota bacterium]